MNGTALPAGAFVINQSVECILNGSVLTVVGVAGVTSVDASDVTYDNSLSGLTAADVQGAIDEVNGKAVKAQGIELTASLSAGATSVTFTDASITATAKLMLFFDDVFIPFTGVTAGVGTVTYNFDALAASATATLWIVD